MKILLDSKEFNNNPANVISIKSVKVIVQD